MTRSRCPGSGRPGWAGRFPGDEDACPECGRRYVTVKQDGTLRAHSLPKNSRPLDRRRRAAAVDEQQLPAWWRRILEPEEATRR